MCFGGVHVEICKLKRPGSRLVPEPIVSSKLILEFGKAPLVLLEMSQLTLLVSGAVETSSWVLYNTSSASVRRELQ